MSFKHNLEKTHLIHIYLSWARPGHSIFLLQGLLSQLAIDFQIFVSRYTLQFEKNILAEEDER